MNLKEIYNKYDLKFYMSLLGPLGMVIIHLISIIFYFDWIIFNYLIFSLLMLLFKSWIELNEKYNMKINPLIIGSISLLLILGPMMTSFIMTIMYKDTIKYIFFWVIYAYATYGTMKMTLAIINLLKKNKNKKAFVESFLGLVGALYTIQMMEFALIYSFKEDGDNNIIYVMWITQAVIFIVTVLIIILFIIKYIIHLKNRNIKDLN